MFFCPLGSRVPPISATTYYKNFLESPTSGTRFPWDGRSPELTLADNQMPSREKNKSPDDLFRFAAAGGLAAAGKVWFCFFEFAQMEFWQNCFAPLLDSTARWAKNAPKSDSSVSSDRLCHSLRPIFQESSQICQKGGTAGSTRRKGFPLSRNAGYHSAEKRT